MFNYDPDDATACEDLCRFLSACFYEPCAEFAEENLFGSMLTAATRIHPGLAEDARRLGTAFAAQDLQTLLVDYTRLFLGPVQAFAQPYGSCWLKSSANADDKSLAVLDLYQAGGFEIAEDFRELPDQVAVELEFLYLLTFTRNEARRTGKMGDVSAVESLERQFLSEHLGAWIGPFAAAVKSGAETAFYRELAGMTEHFVHIKEARLATAH